VVTLLIYVHVCAYPQGFSISCVCVRTHRASHLRACVCIPTGLLIYVLVCAYPQGFSFTCVCVRTHRASHLRACVCVPTGLLIYVRVCAYPQGFSFTCECVRTHRAFPPTHTPSSTALSLDRLRLQPPSSPNSQELFLWAMQPRICVTCAAWLVAQA